MDFDESRTSPFSEKKVLFWKFEEFKLLQKLIDNYLISQDKLFTSKSIQSMLRQELKVLIPLHIIRKMLKQTTDKVGKEFLQEIQSGALIYLNIKSFYFELNFQNDWAI